MIKVFIQATKKDENGKQIEKMFSYDTGETDKDRAMREARGRFDLEHGMRGWEVAGMGALSL